MQDWFKHDFSAPDDPKLLTLHLERGYAGIGMYWTLMAIIGGIPERRCTRSQFRVIAFKMHITISCLTNFIGRLIELELMREENGYVFSNGMKERMTSLDERRIKLSKAGRKGGLVSHRTTGEKKILGGHTLLIPSSYPPHSLLIPSSLGAKSNEINETSEATLNQLELEIELEEEEENKYIAPPLDLVAQKAIEEPRSQKVRKVFKPPSVAEATSYGISIGIPEPECGAWHDHFLTSGWILANGNKMQNWQGSMRTWRSNMARFARSPNVPRGTLRRSVGQFEHTPEDFSRIYATNTRADTGASTGAVAVPAAKR